MRSSIAKPLAPEQADPVAVREVELDPVIARPLDAVHAEGRAQQAVRRRPRSSSVGDAERQEQGELVRKISSPPGRSSRAASGIQR